MIVPLLAAAAVAGFVHGFGPDHCAAVLALGARGRRPLDLAVHFGAGHGALLAVAGGLAAAFGLAVPAGLETGAEVVGGASLVALGVWTLLGPDVTVHRHAHETDGHAHWHVHRDGAPHAPEAHAHRHLAFATGALFAVSGVRGLLLAAPVVVAATRSPWHLAGAVVAFGLGVVAAMALFGWATGPLARLPRLHRWIGWGSVALGLGWAAAA